MSASAQGVLTTAEQLGASDLQTLDLLDQFVETLEVSDHFTGKKPRKSKGGTHGNFADRQAFEQLQLQLYSLTGAPQAYSSGNVSQTQGGRNYIPKVRDQGSCSTCVAQSLASCAEATVASVLQQDAAKWDISPRSLYYCSYGGKTCATGWDIADAMYVAQNFPELLRPGRCGLDSVVETDTGDWGSTCDSASSTCSPSNTSLPLLNCTYKALSTFLQIQQHIRTYGAVVTRMGVHDDFKLFFDPSKTSMQNDIYTVKSDAQLLYGHAVVLVGYDNDNMAWLALNSWGKRVTKDGLFRIGYGVAGAASPTATFGLMCAPAPGTDLDPHSSQPWRQRRAVRLADPAAERTNLTVNCFLYDATSNDTATSLAEAFKVDIRILVHNNSEAFPPAAVNVSMSTPLTAAYMRLILSTLISAQDTGGIEPYFACTQPPPMFSIDTPPPVICTLDNVTSCALLNCSLFYSEQDASASLAGKTLKVCGIAQQFQSVAYFADPRVSQARGLRALLDLLGFPNTGPVPQDYCSQAEWEKLNDYSNPKGPVFTQRWVRSCDADGYVTSLNVPIYLGKEATDNPDMDGRLLSVFLQFERIAEIRMVANRGSMPPQLGSLKSMTVFFMQWMCINGELPPNLGMGWKGISEISIWPYPTAQDVKAKFKLPNCGLTGTLPAKWGGAMRKLRFLTLQASHLAGPIPGEYAGMNSLARLALDNNELTGTLPSSLSKLRFMRSVYLSMNKLQGNIPLSYSNMSLLWELDVTDNAGMGGCAPLSPSTNLEFSGTQITGLCSGDREQVEQQEQAAMWELLPALLNADGLSNVVNITLSQGWLPEGVTTNFLQTSASSTPGSTDLLLVKVELLDGAGHVTWINVKDACLDLRVLPKLAAKLPYLQEFRCVSCNRCAATLPPEARMLPEKLHQAALPRMTSLELSQTNVTGTLPKWENWTTIEALKLSALPPAPDQPGLRLTGRLPPAWGSMSSLQVLQLSNQQLTGGLPPAWGLGPLAGNLTQLWLAGNGNITGQVPATWAAFTHLQIDIHLTNITGCVPDQLVHSFLLETRPACSRNGSAEAAALLAIRALLDPSGATAVLGGWDAASLSGEVAPPGLKPPPYCTNWPGVSCNGLNQVTRLNLASLHLQPQPTQPTFGALLQLLQQLPALEALDLHRTRGFHEARASIPPEISSLVKLRSLDLSDAGLYGVLPRTLSALVNLQYLNVSFNALSGSVPKVFAGLSSLQVLDLSGCGLTGPLPPSFAALQDLQELRLAGNALNGSLPGTFMLLDGLTVLDVSSNKLTGSLADMLGGPAGKAAAAAVSEARHEVQTAQHTMDVLMARAKEQEKAAGGQSHELTVKIKHAQAELQAATRAVQGLRRRAGSAAADDTDPTTAGAAGDLSVQLAAQPASLASLQVLNAGSNALTGLLPKSLGSLKQLRELRLGSNLLQGPLPWELASLRQLQQLDLSGNALAGKCPLGWSGMRQLQHLDLSGNALMGQLPGVWYGLRELVSLDLSGNLLTGGLPQVFGQMGDNATHKLRRLLLRDNPCMNQPQLAASVSASGISDSGLVKVVMGCCSKAAAARAKLCKAPQKGL
ncbi:hypothetical protein OEZ85_010393 [Tetradesmus obliquus]|uniref:4Fe-4S ferredoxin-type domain-containing protein n=1 Tax=Tetradesmus obliquus TaxID=3088 RepID=A0ABY8TMI5_TETOB|nr:hypothetical protein OEZ85_010393 [Tetradesmus obliquus]